MPQAISTTYDSSTAYTTTSNASTSLDPRTSINDISTTASATGNDVVNHVTIDLDDLGCQPSRQGEINDQMSRFERLFTAITKLLDSVVQLLSLTQGNRSEALKPTTTENSSPTQSTLEDETTPTAPTPTHPVQPEKPLPGDSKPDSIDTGRALASHGEFLWKPVSDKDKNLAVLIPSKLTGHIKSVKIISPNGKKVLETGRFTGIGNGERAHYRFDKPGGSYPDGATVLITLKDGTKRHVTIKETSARVSR